MKWKRKTASTPRQKAIKNADKWFSYYIRLKDSDQNGMVRCVTCGKPDHWKKMDCGHYIPRQNKKLRWNEFNCSCQCAKCNYFEGGRMDLHRRYILNRYGMEEINKIDLLDNDKKPYKISIFEVEQIALIYKEKAKKEAEKRNIILK